MNSEYSLTVNDVLKRPLFKDAKVIAGFNGLKRTIKWVHILELSNVEALINGGELILSTGVVQSVDALGPIFLEKLIKHGASSLCLELGYYNQIELNEMIKLAEFNDFPLLVFENMVRFIDITQDLHSLIINKHHMLLETLDSLSREMNQLTLTSQATLNILKLIHNKTSEQTLFLPLQGNLINHPIMQQDEQKELINFIKREKGKGSQDSRKTLYKKNQYIIVQDCGAMGQVWGYLLLILKSRKPEEFDYLILDRASVSITQDLLRRRYIEERKLHTGNFWIEELIHNRISEKDALNHMELNTRNLPRLKFQVCIIEIINFNNQELKILNNEELESFRLHIALMARSILLSHSFQAYMTAKKNQLIIIIVDLDTKKNSATERLKKVVETIVKNTADEKMGSVKLNIGIGKDYSDLIFLSNSYKEAQTILKFNYLLPEKQIIFHKDIGIFGILLYLDNKAVLESFITDNIGQIIEYDKNKNSELLLTLKSYLEHGGSKQATANQLFIVRQSLYHRLEKIKELLGEDFLDPSKRLSIEVALIAYKLENPLFNPTTSSK